MGWSERERVSSCATIHEQGGVTKRDGTGACSPRHSTLAQLVGVTRRWRRNMGTPGVLQAPDLTLFDHHSVARAAPFDVQSGRTRRTHHPHRHPQFILKGTQMTLTYRLLIAALLIALTPLSGVAFAQTTKTPAEPTAQATPAAATAPVTIQSPTDWIAYEDRTYTPVADEISRRLAAARKAFGAKDNKKAAAEMRAVADELKEQAARAAKADTARAKAEMKLAKDTSTRMDLAAKKVTAAAAALENGKIKTQADLDKAIDKAARADMERRWLVTDVTIWYPVSEEPQRHFGSAVEAYAKKDYQAAATEIRKATSYVRLEAGRATNEAKQALQSSVAELDKLAASVEKGAVKDKKAMEKAFSHANHALALAHRAKAAESWTRKEYDKAGYELKAAAHGLESAAGWAGEEAKAGAAAAVADTKALGDKLASGATWAREEVAKGFESLGNAINELGQKIGSSKKAAPVSVGS